MPFQVIFSRIQTTFEAVTLSDPLDKTAVCGSTITAANLTTDEFTFSALGEDFSSWMLAGELFDVTRGGNVFNIVSVNTGTDEFEVDTAGVDYSARYTGGFKFRVQLTGANDGIWTAASASFSGGNTFITTVEDITVDTGNTPSGFTTSLNGTYTTVSATFADPNIIVAVAEDIDHDLDPGTLANADIQWIKAEVLGGDTTGHTYEWVQTDGPALDFYSNLTGVLSGQTEVYIIFGRAPFGNDSRTFRLYIDRFTAFEQFEDVVFKGWPDDPVYCVFGAPSISSSPTEVQMPKGGYGTACRQLDCSDFTATAAFPLAPHNGQAVCAATSFFIGWNPPECNDEQDDEPVGWVVEESLPHPPGGWTDLTGMLPADQRWYYTITPGKSYRIRVYYDNKMGQSDFRGFSTNFARSCSRWVDAINLNGIYAVSAPAAEFMGRDKAAVVKSIESEILSQGTCGPGDDPVEGGEFATGKIEHSKVPVYDVELLTAGECVPGDDPVEGGEFATGKIEHSRVPSYSVVPLDGTDPGG